ncbi:ABC transporter ATP-binding protein [Flavobacterium sp.]|uniref:ABC transporter ATP-binding protein n=1 Tax=Flavobacterium sp. TaxID=239 RepID=UPI00352993B8
MKQAFVHIHQLTIGYAKGKTKTVIKQNIDLSIEKGKLVAVIGKNGIGKSTFLKTITRIIPALSGDIFIKNKALSQCNANEIAQLLSVVLTEKLPPSNLSVYEIVALGRQPYTNWLENLSENDRTSIEKAITVTEISTLTTKKHYEISDGQLQKVLIARALAQDTPLIVLDEPTTHLDLVHKVAVLKLLQKLCKEVHKTILYSTHDLDLAIQMADEIIVFTEEAVYKNTPTNLINNGVFEKIFKNEAVYFDKEKGSFIVK